MLVDSTNCFLFALYAYVASASPSTAVTPEILQPRAPKNNLCGQMNWLRRECAPGRSAMSWDDVCKNEIFEISVPGLCPDYTICDDILEIDYANHKVLEVIQCLPPPAPGTAVPRKWANDPQIGSSVQKRAVVSLANTQMHHEVFIADDMMASVSAVILSEFLL
jgi:hypothetical protein